MQPKPEQPMFPLSRDAQELLVAQHCAALSRRANGLRVMSILVGVALVGAALVLADRNLELVHQRTQVIRRQQIRAEPRHQVEQRKIAEPR